MIQKIENLPENIVGFKALGEVTKNDFESIVLPEVQRVIDREGQLNYLLVLDTSIKNFTFGAWMQDIWLGKHLVQWNRGAIVTNSENIKKFTDIFSKFVPGEFRGFDSAELPQAIQWVAGK